MRSIKYRPCWHPALLNVFLWLRTLGKDVQVDQEVDTFTVGKDREMDLYLAKYDVLGSMAHITMLESIGLLTKEELTILLAELKNIYASCRLWPVCN